MKKLYRTSIVGALLLALTGVALAQTTTNTPPKSGVPAVNKEARDARAEFRTNVVAPIKNEIKDLKDGKATSTKDKIKSEIKDLRGEIKQKRDEFKAEVKKKLEAAAVARLNKNLDNMQEAVARLENINTRIGSRIAKLQAAGENVTLASSTLLIAEGKATDANTAIDTARANIASATAASTTDVNLIKEYVKTAEESVKAAKEATAKAISVLKGLGKPEDSATASSTKRD